MLDEITHHTLGTTLRQPFVIFGRAFVVAVGGKLDGHVGVLVEQFHELVEGGGRLRTQRGLVEVVEDVVNQHRRGDGGQRELQRVFLRLLGLFHFQLLLVVQESAAGGQQHVADARCCHVGERAVRAHAELVVRAVVAHQVYLCRRQFVSVHFVDPSLDGLHDFGVLEAVDVVPSASVASVGTEESAVVRAFERHAEVVGLRVERIARVFQFVSSCALVNLCDEDVEAAHARMAVARKIEVAVGTEGREHLVARRVDGVAQILNTTESAAAQELDAPDVESALAARHVRTEVEPLAVG